MRLFYAVPVSPEVQRGAAVLIEELARTGADVKWVEPGNLHLTLAFLGETAEERLPELDEALARAVSGKPAFNLAFDRLGAFPSVQKPRVVWLGAAEGAEELAALAASLAVPRGEGRPFAAHLTLGRVRGPRSLSRLAERLAHPPVLPRLACRAERVVLFRTRLSSAGPAYEVLRERRLGAGPAS